MKLSILSQNVMCWSCKGGELDARRVRMRRLIERLDPDLIGFQEVNEKWREYFDEDLKRYGAVFKYRGERDREAVPIYWRLDKFDLEDSGWFWLSRHPEKESRFFFSRHKRIATWGIFRSKEDSARFAFINTHLDYGSESVRKKQIKVVRDFAKEKLSGLPLILSGDFNDNAFSPAVDYVRKFMEDSRAAAPVTDETNTHTTKFGSIADATIDYIFTKEVKPLKFSVEKECDGPYPQSDHYGVFVEAQI